MTNTVCLERFFDKTSKMYLLKNMFFDGSSFCDKYLKINKIQQEVINNESINSIHYFCVIKYFLLFCS